MRDIRIWAVLLMTVAFFSPLCVGQDHVVMPTEKGLGTRHKAYSDFDKGFFFATELQGGYSITGKGKGIGLTALNLTAGYRFSDYLRVGAGFGPRYYFDNHYADGYDGRMRNASGNVGMSLFLNARGSFIPSDYKTIVPYWSVNVGGIFPDGFLANPTVGVRIGEKRSAFLLGLSYTLQGIRQKSGADIKHTPCSLLMLNLGYEF